MNKFAKFISAMVLVSGFLVAQEASAAECAGKASYAACINDAKKATAALIKQVQKGPTKAAQIAQLKAALNITLAKINAEKALYLAIKNNEIAQKKAVASVNKADALFNYASGGAKADYLAAIKSINQELVDAVKAILQEKKVPSPS